MTKKPLHHMDVDYFTNIYTLMVLIVTLPVTSCESERSISLKSKLRTSMMEERLNALALIHFRKEIHIDSEEVVTIFGKSN